MLFFSNDMEVYTFLRVHVTFLYKTLGRVFPEAEGYYHRAIFTVFILSLQFAIQNILQCVCIPKGIKYSGWGSGGKLPPI